MGEVICTIVYQENKKRDLVLPDQIPIHQLANVIALSLGLPKNRDTYYQLSKYDGEVLQSLPNSKNLQQSFIINGTTLYLVQETEDPENRAYLENKAGVKMRLRQNSLIGRLTPKAFVDIDLTPMDHEKVVSRQHAAITHVSYHYVIKDLDSHNGTFINNIRLKKDESVVLHSGDVVCFGGPIKGVCLNFENN